MTKTQTQWLQGLIGAVLNAAATGILLLITDPTHFESWTRLPAAMGAMALVGAALWLKQHQFPTD